MYPWIVYLHVLGGFVLMLAHGSAVAMALALRRERRLERIRALLDLSRSTEGALYGSLLLLLIAGVAAGFAGSWWGSGWIWLSLGLLILLVAQMFSMGTRYYARVRQAAGEPVSEAEMDRLLGAAPAIPLAASGLVILAAILWLMMFKPF
jgi:hypothetical protein